MGQTASVSTVPAYRPDRLFGRIFTKYGAAYFLVLPAIIWRMVFTLIPLIQTIVFSFTDKSIVKPGTFVGLKNYLSMAQDDVLLESLGFTVVYTLASMLIEAALGLGIAMLLTQKLRGKWLSNFIMLLPWVMAPLLAAIVWKLMFIEDGGILYELLRTTGLVSQPIHWLSEPTMARISVIVVTVWKNVSWVALIFIAGLGSLPQEVLEAAAVDGAGAWQRFWYVTMPLLRPSIYLVLMFRGMGEAQTFEQIFGLTAGGPGTATQTLALYAYKRFFQELRYGYGSAINVMLLLFTIAVGGVFAWRLYRSNR